MSLSFRPLALVVCAALCLTGCGPVSINIPGKTLGKPVVALPAPLLGQADAAWRLGDMAQAERLYDALRRDPNLPAAQYETVFSRLSEAALACRHPELALDALSAWSRVMPQAASGAAWLTLWGRTLLALPAERALTLARAAGADALASTPLRAQALGVLLVRGPAEERQLCAENAGALYITSETGPRAVMERGLLSLSEAFTPDGLVEVLQYTLPDTDRTFPWSVLLLEKARREARNRGGADAQASPTLARISGPGVFADSALLADALREARPQETFVPVVSKVPLYPGCTALALPMSGRYSAIGKRVAAGAGAARAELVQAGVETQLVIVDTDLPDWTDTLAALPSQCVTVGGPLLPAAYTEAKSRNLPARHAFFTFFPALEGTDEGRVAWRFFSSPRDQINALLSYATQADVRSFGVLYPDEPYGRRMAGLFLETAPGGATSAVSASKAYPPDDINKWNDLVSAFVGSEMIGKVPSSNAAFEAVFLPDSWEKASLLIPYLFFNGEDRLLIMGSSLWEQKVSEGTKLDISNVRLAIFPAAWNRVNPTPSARNLAALLNEEQDPDFWSGIGYDFVRFAAALHLAPGWSVPEVNARLGIASQIPWSMAPLSWTARGLASQALFVFSPGASGVRAVDPQTMRARIGQVRDRYERRMENARDKARTEKAKLSQQEKARLEEEARRDAQVRGTPHD